MRYVSFLLPISASPLRPKAAVPLCVRGLGEEGEKTLPFCDAASAAE